MVRVEVNIKEVSKGEFSYGLNMLKCDDNTSMENKVAGLIGTMLNGIIKNQFGNKPEEVSNHNDKIVESEKVNEVEKK